MTAIPKGHTAVMAQRVGPPNSLEYFPTPPWSTRALCEVVLGRPPGLDVRPDKSCWEPAAGEGHMVEVLRDYFREVHASDVHDYGKGYAVGSFIGEGPDRAEWPVSKRPDWVITNPPFQKAAEFAERGIAEARCGMALLLRTAWLESGDRYRDLFTYRPPSIVAVFAERVPMTKGRWDPDASTATSYAWFVWSLPLKRDANTRLMWIPPGQRTRLERPNDRRRFGVPPEPMALFATQDGIPGGSQ